MWILLFVNCYFFKKNMLLVFKLSYFFSTKHCYLVESFLVARYTFTPQLLTLWCIQTEPLWVLGKADFTALSISLTGNLLARCSCIDTSYTSIHVYNEGHDCISSTFYLFFSHWWLSRLLPSITITNNTAMNTLIYMSYRPMLKFPWDKCQL